MRRAPMRTVRRVLAGLSLLLAPGALAEPPPAVVASHLAGQSIYRDGLLAFGRAGARRGAEERGAERR
jgi:hypothetical protein